MSAVSLTIVVCLLVGGTTLAVAASGYGVGAPLLAFVACWAACAAIYYGRSLLGVALDPLGAGPQKFHTAPTPRIGGVALFLGLLPAFLIAEGKQATFLFLLLLASLPVFVGGLIEDLTKRFSPTDRLLASFAAAGLGFLFMDGRVTDLALPGTGILEFSVLSFLFTVFAVGGFAHALNIVDGFNGLSGAVALLMLAALGLVAAQVGDHYVLSAAVIIGAAVVAFLLWNFPRGLIFSGDSGAYLLGFLIAELAVVLAHRNSEVSPWFPLSLLLYPVVETCFSMYRKKVLRGQSPGEPDGLHLHMLVYKRLVRTFPQTSGEGWKANALTSPYLVALSALSIVPSVLAWQYTVVLQAVVVSFTLCYVWLYWRIVRFRTPGLFVLRSVREPRAQTMPEVDEGHANV